MFMTMTLYGNGTFAGCIVINMLYGGKHGGVLRVNKEVLCNMWSIMTTLLLEESGVLRLLRFIEYTQKSS